MSRKIRVMIADDHEDRSVSQLFAAQEDMEILAEVTDGEQMVADACRLSPDIVVMDLSLAGAGLRALEQLSDARPDIRVVVLAVHDDISLLRTVLAVGSLGYVVNRASKSELVSVVRKIAQGRGYVDVPTGGLPVDPRLQPQVPRSKEIQEKLDMLSKRESEVLKAVAYGFTNREIAERLGISVKSIETYRYRVAEKLNFNSRADLVRFALEAGL
ncbi:MAG: response regulator transcription factor, partial [Holophagales bacterium]|nr:response regulator transcription factor [Holophagales bacterium]